MPLLGACSTIVVAVVVAASVSTPGALHDTVADATKIDVVAVTVMVRVSPLTSASVTPMLNTIEVGTAPATRVLTVGALVHVSAVSTVAAIVLVVVAVVAVEESPTVNVTVVGVADTAFAARPPTHVIAVEAAAMPAEPTVSVSVAPLTALPPAAICEAPAVHTGASAPTAHCAWPAESIVTVSPLVSAVPKTIVNTMFVGVTPETSESATAEAKASAVTASTV
jgi:hypothetical protein